MIRRDKTHIRFKKNGIEIRLAYVGEEYEIGNWVSYYNSKIGFNVSTREMKYSDIMYVITYNKIKFGYFLAYCETNRGNKEYIPLNSKELVLYDFAVECRAYAKFSKILINYMIDYAKYNGYNAISFKKIEEYKYFNEFLKKNYKINETDDIYYILIENPRIKTCQKHLNIYNNDSISLDDLYFLYALKCNILKNRCTLKLSDNYCVSVDRKTGIIYFPENVKIIKDHVLLNDITRNLIYLIILMHYTDKIEPLDVYYDLEHQNYYEAYTGNTIYISKTFEEINEEIKNNLSLLIKLYKKGFSNIVPSIMNYDMDENSFSYSNVILNTNELINKFAEKADSNAKTLPEFLIERKNTKLLNDKLDGIKKFYFSSEESNNITQITFIFEENVEITTNVGKTIVNKEEVIKELKGLYFYNWKPMYVTKTPANKTKWKINITLESDEITYIGAGEFPNIWPLFELFINKYLK